MNKNELKSILDTADDNKGFTPEIDKNVLTNETKKGKEELNNIFNLDEENITFKVSPKSDLKLRLLSIQESILVDEILLTYLETSGLTKDNNLYVIVSSLYKAVITLVMAATEEKIKRGSTLYEISNKSMLGLGTLLDSPSSIIQDLYARYLRFVSKYEQGDKLEPVQLDNIIKALKEDKIAIADLHFDESVQIMQYFLDNLDGQ